MLFKNLCLIISLVVLVNHAYASSTNEELPIVDYDPEKKNNPLYVQPLYMLEFSSQMNHREIRNSSMRYKFRDSQDPQLNHNIKQLNLYDYHNSNLEMNIKQLKTVTFYFYARQNMFIKNGEQNCWLKEDAPLKTIFFLKDLPIDSKLDRFNSDTRRFCPPEGFYFVTYNGDFYRKNITLKDILIQKACRYGLIDKMPYPEYSHYQPRDLLKLIILYKHKRRQQSIGNACVNYMELDK